MMKNNSIFARFSYAFNGLKQATLNEHSFRTELCAIPLVIVMLVYFKASLFWCAIVSLSLFLVLVSELINSAVECFLDAFHPDIHPQTKIVKDILAGAVLLSCCNSIVTLILFLFTHCSML